MIRRPPRISYEFRREKGPSKYLPPGLHNPLGGSDLETFKPNLTWLYWTTIGIFHRVLANRLSPHYFVWRTKMKKTSYFTTRGFYYTRLPSIRFLNKLLVVNEKKNYCFDFTLWPIGWNAYVSVHDFTGRSPGSQQNVFVCF